MELFILLLLSICCCCQAKLLQLDCNDHDVFNAVDIALKRYNGGRRRGSVFALSRILEANTTTDPGKNFLLKYEIRETACTIEEEVPWQNCRFIGASEGDSGECTAEVHTDVFLSLSSVKQSCIIKPAPGKVTLSHSPCLGCWECVNTKKSELQPIVRYGMEQFNNRSNIKWLFDVGDIIKAQTQVVNGWNYKIDYQIKKTNCTKNKTHKLTPECHIIPGDLEGICKISAYEHYTGKIMSATQTCTFTVNKIVDCTGCPVNISPHSPELQEPLSFALKKYNSESHDDFYYKVVVITEATAQIVAGIIYRIDFDIGRTNCSKAEFPIMNDSCTTTKSSPLLTCNAEIYEKPWESAIPVITVNCTKKMQAQVARRLPGFTPFRSIALTDKKKPHEDVQKQEIPKQPSTSKPFLQQEDEDFFRSLNQGSPGSSISLFDRLPDLPEPLAPKCPGRPWKPIALPVAPLQEDFKDFTLEDLLPLPDEVTAEPHKTDSDANKQNSGGFDLADALL
ncbi:kininogen-1 [Elgaria multicarinata webbii]|uniref:kininogen-1 n=1 Tax=Elgaria multicarinata webbii TaxID=159646 RepID=UPI002FCD66B1